MSGPYEILNARVQQKKATEEYWLSIEDELGPILAGEQCFVVDDDGNGVNFKIGDGTRKFSELPYFIAYYSTALNQKILSYLNANTNQTITGTFHSKSSLYNIVFVNSSGSDIPMKIGTTNGGNELLDIVLPDGVYTIDLKKVFQTDTTIYITGLAGHTYSMFIIYFQYDEHPAIPPTPASGATFRWPPNTKGMYEPLADGDLDRDWDFTTGRGVAGTVWENCAISGTNGTEDMGRFYPVGWKVGDSLFPATTFGNSAQSIQISKNNLPSIQPLVKGQRGGKPGFGNGQTGIWVAGGFDQSQNTGDTAYKLGEYGGTRVPINIAPLSKICLFWVAIEP